MAWIIAHLPSIELIVCLNELYWSHVAPATDRSDDPAAHFLDHPMTSHDPGGLGRELSAAIIGFHQAVADHLGLSAADHKALEVVLRHGPLPASSLARQVRLGRSSTTALIDRLEAAGQVRREPDPDDRRRVLVVPTPSDRGSIGQAYGSLGTAMARTMAGFTSREQQTIQRYVTATIDVLHDQTDRLHSR
jgi:DNA-binding MarR family transcriptional regulator